MELEGYQCVPFENKCTIPFGIFCAQFMNVVTYYLHFFKHNGKICEDQQATLHNYKLLYTMWNSSYKIMYSQLTILAMH